MEEELTKHQIHCHNNYTKNKEIKNEERKNIKIQCLSHYSNGTPKCSYPGCTVYDIEVLTIDHINGGGRREQRERNYQNIYKFLIDNNFPDGYRVLCFNHNFKEAHTKEFLEKNREKRAGRGELITGRLMRMEKKINNLDSEKDKLIKKYEYLIEKALNSTFKNNLNTNMGIQNGTNKGEKKDFNYIDKIVEEIFSNKKPFYSNSRKKGIPTFLDVNLIRYKYSGLSNREALMVKTLVEKKTIEGQENGTTKQ